jgi:hypothetical protein
MPDCEFYEVIDWDEDTQEIYHAVCTLPSPVWPNCNRCKSKAEYNHMEEN